MRRLNTNYEVINPAYINPDVEARYPQHSLHLKEMITQINNHEGCQLTGYLDVYKVFHLLLITRIVSRINRIFYCIQSTRTHAAWIECPRNNKQSLACA